VNTQHFTNAFWLAAPGLWNSSIGNSVDVLPSLSRKLKKRFMFRCLWLGDWKKRSIFAVSGLEIKREGLVFQVSDPEIEKEVPFFEFPPRRSQKKALFLQFPTRRSEKWSCLLNFRRGDRKRRSFFVVPNLETVKKVRFVALIRL
jgi:hypothetical protein